MSHLRVFFSYVAILTLLCDISNALRTKTSSSYSEDRINRFSNRNADADDDEYRARNYVSEHEKPKDVPVKVRIQGDLATPPPDAGINLGFVPKQTYYQVRRYDTKVHLPRSAAVEEADTAEELLNAPRLREVVSHKKTQQVYEEQGYEDAAYDHGGYKKGAQRFENKHLAPPAEDDDAAGPTAEAEYTSGSNQRARIDHQPEPKHIDSSRSENATSDGVRGSTEDTNDSSESSPKRKSRDETTKRYSGETDDNEDVSDVPRYKPKPRGVSGLRQKSKKVDDAESTKAQSTKPPGSVTYVKRRRKVNNRYLATNSTLGNTKNPLDIDTKTGQESKTVRSKLKSTNRQNRPESRYVKAKNTDKPEELLESDYVSATTYRPLTIPDTLSLRLQTIANANAKRKPSPLAAGLPSNRIVHQHEERTTSAPAPVPSSFSKNILVDNSGYVFENPFAHFQTTYPPLKWKGPAVAAAAPVAYAVNERPMEFHQTPILPPRSYSNASSIAKSKYLRSNSKRFPYDIVKANSDEVPVPTPARFAPSPDHDAIISAKWRKKASLANGRFKTKPSFPYEIVTASASSGQDTGAKWPEKYRFSRKRPKQSRFKNASSPFGTADDSPWIPITPKEAYDIHGYNARRKNSAGVETAAAAQIPVTESLTTENLPVKRKMSPIRVLENDSKESRPLARTVSTSYSIKHEYEPGWLDKPVHRFEGWWTTTVPPQINESFDSQRKLFEDTMKAQSPSTTTNSASSREWTDDSKDIETLSSNRYTVYQPFEYTTSLSTTPLAGKVDEKLLQYRHPYLPRETTHLEPTSAPQSQNLTSRMFNDTAPVFNTTKLISTSRNFTQLKNSSDNDRKPDKIIVYPASVGGVDYASTASFVQNLTLAHFADPNNSVHSSLPLNYRDRFNTLKDHLAKNKTSLRKIRSASTNQQLLNVYMDGSTTEIAVDLRKYPFYKSVSEARSVGGNPLAKYSVLRYISNPNMVPTKTAGQMSFYQSTNRIRCPEPDAPLDVPIPERERDGDWIGDEEVKGRGEPRVKNVGRSIMCHKIKFFGSDPLDNPFFKEESIGFPLIFPSSASPKKRSKTKRAAIIATHGANDDANSANKKTVRKMHLAGGFINQRDYSSDKDVSFGSSTIKTTTLANEVNLTTSSTDASVVATTMTTTTSMVKNAHTTPIVVNAPGDNRINLANPTYKLSSDYRIPIDKSKKKVYIDSDTNASERVPLKPQYKEPSWRNKKRQQAAVVTTVSTPAEVDVGGHVTPNSRVDSLLYVIHPHSGRGKWMKILKVEQLPDDKKNSASENVEIRPKQTKKDESVVPNSAKGEDQFVQRNHRNSCDSNVGLGFGFGFGQSNEMTQQTWPRDGIKRANVPVPVQVPQAADQTYQISGLLRQVAPLKASQVEINNLQTTAADDHLEVDVDSDGDEIIIPPSLSHSSIQPRYKHRDHIQFPQPHERLYYYVVDE